MKFRYFCADIVCQIYQLGSDFILSSYIQPDWSPISFFILFTLFAINAFAAQTICIILVSACSMLMCEF